MVDALGGSKGRNVIGRSAVHWRNLAARYLVVCRTARGYRRVSWGFRNPIVVAGKQNNVAGAGAAAAAQQFLVEGRNAESRHADGVSVGSDHF